MAQRDELLDRLAMLEERVAALESEPNAPVSGLDPEIFWALTGLRERLGDSKGQVLFTGAVELPTGQHFEWQQGALADRLLDVEWPDFASAFGALGHPVRMMLVQKVLTGTTTVAGLQALDGVGTTGQLYHHLKQLVSAGWLEATGRGHYSVPASKVVPLLVLISMVAPSPS